MQPADRDPVETVLAVLFAFGVIAQVAIAVDLATHGAVTDAIEERVSRWRQRYRERRWVEEQMAAGVGPMLWEAMSLITDEEGR